MQIHGSCAARKGAAVVFLGASGSGKSDLVFRLLDRGFVLIADDRVELNDGWASPPEPLAGLLELRGLGLIRVPHLERARVVLAVRLGTPERLPAPQMWDQLPVPLVTIDPFVASAAQMVEWALDVALKQRPLVEGAMR
jgi:HPr kinase/phosphorylase